MLRKSILILFSLFFFTLSHLFSQTVDTTLSNVRFEISNFKVNTVEGKFGIMQGKVNFKENDLSSSTIDVCISTHSIDTDNKKRDEHLRNEDFFNVEKYPIICFTSSEIIEEDNHYITKGELSLHGVKKEISIPFTKKKQLLEGSFKINRLDYNLGESTGTFTVGNEVLIHITCVVLDD